MGKGVLGCPLRRITAGPKGSYRAEHCESFLRWALPKWTPVRGAANDWRLMYLDAYSAHQGKDLQDIAWRRGFVPVYHGGCTTGIAQVNDTDLHGVLEQDYLHCEAIAFVDQQIIDPGNIGRTRQQVFGEGVVVSLCFGIVSLTCFVFLLGCFEVAVYHAWWRVSDFGWPLCSA